MQINSTDQKVAEDDRARLETTIEVTVLSAETIDDCAKIWIYV